MTQASASEYDVLLPMSFMPHDTNVTSHCPAGACVLLGMLAVACSERLVDFPDEMIGKPYCVIIDSRGYYEDGSSRLIVSPDGSPAGCTCALPEERTAEETLERLNEAAFEACKAAAAPWDFDWDECQDDFESEAWLWHVFYAGDDSDYAGFRTAGLECVDE